ncbi:MAG: septum formation initiator family protein [Clostridia bacterium]|nr:septum formation initiator family protein [Clostridia bacterium]
MEKKKNSIVRITVYCLIVVFLIAIINLQINMNELRDTIDKQDEQIVGIEDDIAEYNIMLTEEKDDDYYERRARELNYHFRNEIIFYNDFAE